MDRSRLCGLTPSPTESAPCGSKSTSSTLRPYSASAAPRLMVVVVLPTPPFWLAIAMMRAGPCRSVRHRLRDRAAHRVGGRVGRTELRAEVHGGLLPAELRGPRLGTVAVASHVSFAPSRRRSSASEPSTSFAAPRRTPVCRPTRPRRCPTVRHDTARQSVTGSACRTYARIRFSAAGARVGGGVHLAQPLHGDQGVDLGGGHRRVPEQLLHHPDVGAAVEQVGGVRVAQRVRRDRAARPPAARPPAARRRIAQAPCRDSGPPRALRKTAGVPRPPAASSAGRARTRYARSAGTAYPPIGTSRVRPPLPRSSTVPVGRGRGRRRRSRPPRRCARRCRTGTPAAPGRAAAPARLASPGRPALQQPDAPRPRRAPWAAGAAAPAGVTSRLGSCAGQPFPQRRTGAGRAPRSTARAADAADSGGWSVVARAQPGQVRRRSAGADRGRGRRPRRRPGVAR